ncbi:MAG: DUF4250 domain-containing protein [Chromatiales bacterium]|nr:DUF4250 domain-containing protein [Chromatiales bacterium]
MAPAMLYSLLNMKLRNDYRDLDDLTLAMNIDRQALEAYLRERGIEYHAQLRQFRMTPG